MVRKKRFYDQPKLIALEAQYQMPIRSIVAHLFSRYASLTEVANELGVTRVTLQPESDRRQRQGGGHPSALAMGRAVHPRPDGPHRERSRLPRQARVHRAHRPPLLPRCPRPLATGVDTD